MAYKLIESAQARWRKVNAPELVTRGRAGALFHKGKLLGRADDITPASSTSPTEPTKSEALDLWRELFGPTFPGE